MGQTRPERDASMLATPRSTCTQAKGTRSWLYIRQAPANPITAFVQGFCCTVARVTANLTPSAACKIHPILGVMRLPYQTRL
ncbi:CBL-interacting serine/threonine-protein kinase 21 [Fusarium oxysporum f. sp. albedinis]|nr:CBL-interacting serine/threonine-protein kinase 21 [Fusarium oxysporum f. sp. albedinis]